MCTKRYCNPLTLRTKHRRRFRSVCCTLSRNRPRFKAPSHNTAVIYKRSVIPTASHKRIGKRSAHCVWPLGQRANATPVFLLCSHRLLRKIRQIVWVSKLPKVIILPLAPLVLIAKRTHESLRYTIASLRAAIQIRRYLPLRQSVTWHSTHSVLLVKFCR